ncbi:MAG TPA: MFS transporter [Pyrinomonadaceae bacterium]|nr:MFS transporter [Pyrinomonadaceae bacterium]
MNSLTAELRRPPLALPFYYGWVHVFIAALAMVGTLPGRTQGLGLITEPLLKDLQIDRVHFARINLWATLIGALFSLGVGRLIDRFGSRIVLTVVTISLASVVFGMSATSNVAAIAILITLTRGLGQSALSVVSITMVGQWFVRRLNLAMAVYTIALSIGFMLAFPLIGAIVLSNGWRTAWWIIGVALLAGLAPLALLLVRRSPESLSIDTDGEVADPSHEPADYTLREALSTPSFWVFGISSAVYGLIASGIALFNESILAERRFDASTYHRSLVIVALTSLVGNFLGGWIASKWKMNRLLSLAMLLLAGSLVALPHVSTQLHVALYAAVMGLAGGFVIVIFFSFWSASYGRKHLGKIQGAAQALTVIASALGPLILAETVSRTGSYASIFYILTIVVTILALLAWLIKMPGRNGISTAVPSNSPDHDASPSLKL